MQSPKGTIIPENYVWLIFTPFEVLYQSVADQRGSAMRVKRVGEQIKLLAPETINYSLGHSWGEYESISTRLLGKLGEFAKLKSEGEALHGSLSNIAQKLGTGAAEAIRGNIKKTAESVLTAGKTLHRGLAGARVVNVKVDMPLVFQGSERRSFALEFNLVAIEDAKTEVYDIVKNIELYSAAQSKDNLNIDPPYVFNIRTEPGDIINVDKAALEFVQPTWNAPYDKNGYPRSCSLTLTFKDMSPLYRRTLEQGGYTVTTSTR